MRATINGATLICESATGMNSVFMGVGVGRGAQDDPPGEAGLAHFCEHVRVAQINRTLGPRKARVLSVEAFTERNETYFVVCALKQDACVLGDWLAAFLNPRPLDDDSIEQERRILAEEVATLEDSEINRIENEFLKAAYGAEHLWRPIGGQLADIAGLAGACIDRTIRNDNAQGKLAVVLVGDIVSTGLQKALEGTLMSVSRPPDSGAARPGRTHRLAAKRLAVSSSLGVGYFMLGYPAFPRHDPRRVSLFAASLIFGEDAHSVLFKELRTNRALLYAVNSECHLFKDHGHLVVKGVVAYEKLDEVIGHVVEIAGSMADRVSDREVQEEARQALMRTLLMRLDDPRNRLTRLLKHEMWLEKYLDYDEDIEFIHGVTHDSLSAVTQEVLQSSPLICYGVAHG